MPQDKFKAVLKKSGGSMEMLTTEDTPLNPTTSKTALRLC